MASRNLGGLSGTLFPKRRNKNAKKNIAGKMDKNTLFFMALIFF